MECLEQKIDEVIKVNQWQGFVSGKVVGGLAVLETLNIDKERRVDDGFYQTGGSCKANAETT